MALTVGKAARMFRMSRTALLYYDEIGLVKPSQRSGAGYRLYGEADIDRLSKVIAYREAGIPLDDIAGLLSGKGTGLEALLLKRLECLNGEIAAAKKRQAAVVGIIRGLSSGEAANEREKWRRAVEEAGFAGSEGERLHMDFEEHSPLLHEEFLCALGFSDDEMRKIREFSRQK